MILLDLISLSSKQITTSKYLPIFRCCEVLDQRWSGGGVDDATYTPTHLQYEAGNVLPILYYLSEVTGTVYHVKARKMQILYDIITVCKRRL